MRSIIVYSTHLFIYDESYHLCPCRTADIVQCACRCFDSQIHLGIVYQNKHHFHSRLPTSYLVCEYWRHSIQQYIEGERISVTNQIKGRSHNISELFIENKEGNQWNSSWQRIHKRPSDRENKRKAPCFLHLRKWRKCLYQNECIRIILYTR